MADDLHVADASQTTSLTARLMALRAAGKARAKPLAAPYPAFTVALSISDGTARALSLHGSGETFDAAFSVAESALLAQARQRRLSGRFLRLDWVERAEALTWEALGARLREVKRNYSRKGLALDAGFARLFLEQELNANAMLYSGAKLTHAALNPANFSIYARQKYPAQTEICFAPETEVHSLETSGIFCGEDGVLHPLGARGREAGRRQVDARDPEVLLRVISDAASFLADQVGPDGRFVYGYHPCFDRVIATYNALRHASTCYSMLEAWELTRCPYLLAAIERALDYLVTEFIKDGPEGAAFVVDGVEVKLGANATAILAMAKHEALFGTGRYLGLAARLAEGIRVMQGADGSFSHVLRWPELAVKDRFRIIYYEGEAAFALMRLYSLTKDPRWLETTERAFDYFIAAEHWRHHDHWLGYCTNELTIYRPEPRYFRFGIQNFSGHLDFVLQRITTFPTLLEMMMAGRRMLDRIKARPDAEVLLAGVNEAKFDRAMHFRAAYLMNGHFWPEFAMFFRNPQRILGSFFIRHHAFRVRIDDVEHYLSGLVAYHDHLLASRG